MKRKLSNDLYRAWAILSQDLDGRFTVEGIKSTRKLAYEAKDEGEVVVQCDVKIKLIERKRNA